MAITPLPTPPSRSDPANFADRGDAFLSALPTFVTEANALATATNQNEINAELAEVNAETAQAAAEAAQAAAEAAQAAAETAEDNALISQNAAAASATNAAASYDAFDDRYLGAKGSDPATDNDGNPLLTGALYWNTVSNVMKAWTGSTWVVTYVPSSGSLTTSDIGVTVQAYDSNLTSFVTTFTLPVADGANGQALVTNGSGTLSFGSAGISTGKSIAMAMIFGF